MLPWRTTSARRVHRGGREVGGSSRLKSDRQAETEREMKREHVLFDMWVIVTSLGKIQNDRGENLRQ